MRGVAAAGTQIRSPCFAPIRPPFLCRRRPYLHRLRAEARCIAGLLSQLPPEVHADEALKAQLVPAAQAAPGGGLSVALAAR